jgi:hypothetical protein
MEHRYGIRQSSGIEAILQSTAVGRMRVHIRDVSIGGLFIVMPTEKLALRLPVRVGFVAKADSGRHVHRINGVVTRVAEDGVALSFNFLPVSAQLALLSLLHSEPPAQMH